MLKVIDILVNGNSDVVNKSLVISSDKSEFQNKIDHKKFLLQS